MSNREMLKQSRRWIVKIGSSLLTHQESTGEASLGLNVPAIQAWVRQIAGLRKRGIECVLVSSGAVAAGMARLGWRQRPSSINELQAAAAVGQMGLIQAYERAFLDHGLRTAQILLDHDDLSNRKRYLNARATLSTLVNLQVIPVVNENDTVVTDEIRFGDNDTLAALVANLISADVLVLLTDQQGMYSADPRYDKEATLIDELPAEDSSLDEMASDGGSLGRGGMVTKVRAARLAARSGTQTIIVGGRLDDVIIRLAAGESLGTLLATDQRPQAARKLWLAGQLQCRGELLLDDGAVRVLQQSGRSLLPVGVKAVKGRFTRGDLVSCRNSEGREIARGLVNYSDQEVEKIKGESSGKIKTLLGYSNEQEIIHRDNLVLV